MTSLIRLPSFAFGFLLLIGLMLDPAAAADPAPRTKSLKGQVALWTRPVCNQPECALPKPLGVTWDVDVTFEIPTATGSTLVAQRRLDNRNWGVELIWVWVNPPDGSVPYLVQQVRLFEGLLGLVAECSRYDGVDAFDFLPPGACSGRSADQMIGVTVSAKR